MKIHTFKNKNNLGVLLIEESKLPTITIGLGIRCGAINEDNNKNGVASISRSICTRGSKRYPSSLELNTKIEQLGAYLDSSNGRELTLFSLQSEPKHFTNILDLLFEVINNPLDREKDINNIKDKHIKNIHELKDDARAYTVHKFQSLVWKESLLENSPIGKIEDIKKIKKHDIQKFRKNNWTNENSLLIICGNIKKENVSKEVDKYSLDYNSTIKNKKEKITASHNLEILKKDLPQTVITLGGIGPNSSSKDIYKFKLARILLGSGFGSRLMQNIREKGLAYYSYATSSHNLLSGNWCAVTGIAQQQLYRVIETIINELRNLAQGKFTKKELDRAKELMRGAMISYNESSPEIAQFYGVQYFDLNKTILIEQIIEEIKSTTKDDLVRIYKKYYSNPYSVVINGIKKLDTNKISKIIE